MADWKLLMELLDTPGIPGQEDKIREIVKRELAGLADDWREDPLGNVIFHFKGDGPVLLLDAHMDEVGFMVSRIEKGGFLRVISVGGIPPENALSQRVIVWGKEQVYGIFGSIPPHVRKSGNGSSLPEIEDLFVDTGLSEERVKELISPGDPVTFDTKAVEKEGVIYGKAFDDRAGVFVMIEAVKRAKKRSVDLYLVAASQEEVGMRGAKTAAYDVEPFMAIALEGTVAMDIPEVPEHKRLAKLGEGPEIRLSDRSFVASKKWVNFIVSTARKRNIKHQIIVKRVGGTDASVIQLTGRGVHTTAISVPVRYIHSANSLALKEDIEATIELVAAIIEEGGEFAKSSNL